MLTQMKTHMRRWKWPALVSIPFHRTKSLPPHPKGKLGAIIKRLEVHHQAVSLEDLITLTGWKRTTVHAALSRLRTRGFPITKMKSSGRSYYALNGRD